MAGGLPGDRLRARIGKSKRSWAEAAPIELIEPAPDRIPDRCVHGGEPCPGAAWQGLPYEAQLAHKEMQVREALERLGGFKGLEGVEVEPIVPAIEQWRYRNKLEYSFGEGEGGADPVLGFHARGRWDQVVDVDDCLLASEANNAARNAVREWARTEGLKALPETGSGRSENPTPANDENPRGSGREAEHSPVTRGSGREAEHSPVDFLRNLVVRDGRRSGQIQTRLITTAGAIPKPPVDLHTVIAGPSGGTGGPTGVLGEEYLREQLCGLDLRVSHEAFLQTNTETAERLYAAAREFAGLKEGERLFDLYCGIGTIGLSMAADLGASGELWGVESVADAIVDAEANAERNSIGNAHFRTGDARLGIRPLIEEAGKPDVVVIDPPRAGLSAKIVRRVLECEADRIVYVSCNPTTMAPNARQMVDAGYRLTRVRPVDMFPQTSHIECVALLERGQGGAR